MRTSWNPLPLVAVSIAPLLSSCGLGSGGSGLDDALGYLPADSTEVTFVDRVAVAERLDVADLGHEDADAYVEALIDAAWVTEFARYAYVQPEGTPLTEFDIVWQATARTESSYARVWKVDDVDFEELAEALEDGGYTAEDGEHGTQRFLADPGALNEDGTLLAGGFPLSFVDVTLVPDEDLVIGGDPSDVIATLAGEEESAADAGTFEDLVDRADATGDLEYADLRVAESACVPPVEEEEFLASMNDLRAPEARGFFADGDEVDRTVLLFADADEAAADAERRDDYLDEFAAVIDADLGADLEVDGDVQVISTDVAARRVVAPALQRGEGTVACWA